MQKSTIPLVRKRNNHYTRRRRHFCSPSSSSFSIMLLLSLKSTVRFSGAFSIHKASWWIPSEVLRKFTSKETNAADMIDSIVQPTVFEKWLDVELAEGRCVGVKTNIDTTEEIFKPKDLQDSNHWAHALYHPEELSYGMNIGAGSQSYSFWLGRMVRFVLTLQKWSILYYYNFFVSFSHIVLISFLQILNLYRPFV
jgi:hypothetical protein